MRKAHSVETQFMGDGRHRMVVTDHAGEVIFSARGRSDTDIAGQMPIDLLHQMVSEGNFKPSVMPHKDEMLIRAIKQLELVLSAYEPGDVDIKITSEDSREACGYEVSVFRKKMERIL